MKLSHRLIIAATALLGLWAGLAYEVSQPPDAAGYVRTALQVAERRTTPLPPECWLAVRGCAATLPALSSPPPTTTP
ncbi:hypothetical protein [Micromonospora sp. CB01531]|uniref:hypothetical protein n=1 Tax=Micromonospora sp. CB01531 TaxID=1718947 RepID=UPI000B046F2A|nr:hypothetical protein [Micromonospora sp. CB01531]